MKQYFTFYRAPGLEPQQHIPNTCNRSVNPIKNAVGVFYSPSRLGQLVGESYPSEEMQWVNSTALVDWATRFKAKIYS